MSGFRVVEGLPRTGYEAPNAEELRRLFQIVTAARPELLPDATLREFGNAMWAVGHFRRTVAPWSGQYFSFWVNRANELIETVGMFPLVNGATLMTAVLGHGDICWRAREPLKGQLLEIGLSAYSGRPCSNAWRKILSGEANILAPVPSERKEQGLTIVRSASEL